MSKLSFRAARGATAVAACCLSLGVPVASAGNPGFGNPFGCKVNIAGHQWLVAGHGLDCGSATAVIKQLANKRSPAGFFPGKYAGMKCASTSAPGTKPGFIGCGDGKAKNIQAYQT